MEEKEAEEKRNEDEIRKGIKENQKDKTRKSKKRKEKDG